MEHNHVPEFVAEVRRGKALAALVENAVVKDSNGNLVELRTLMPDGTYGDPDADADGSGAAAALDDAVDDAASVVATADYIDSADTSVTDR
jgi:trigger factor